MRGSILQKFREWTGRPGDKAVNVFDAVRDIPFAVEPEQYSRENGPAGMLNINMGFCVPKHYLLGEMYRELGIKIKYCVCPFRWADLAMLSPAIHKAAKALPVTHHLMCKAFIKGKWIAVDATWDAPLAVAGFPVNSPWDGKTDTINAVKPIEEHVISTDAECAKLLKDSMDVYSLSEKLALTRFSVDLNKWLANVRAR
jgi:hypothetical protein